MNELNDLIMVLEEKLHTLEIDYLELLEIKEREEV